MQEHEPQKIGAGHAKAMGRQGLKELTQALPAFPPSGIQPVEEPGLTGNLTPQEIVHGKGSYEDVLRGYAARGQNVERQQELDRGQER